MLNILVYTDGRSDSTRALHLAGNLHRYLEADLSIITVRSGTHATETIPPVGKAFPLSMKTELPEGIQSLVRALEDLTSSGLFAAQKQITIHDISSGYIFVQDTVSGDRVPFYIRYGHFIEVLNKEVAEKKYDLVIISPPQRSKLRNFVLGDTTRLLALDLHASILLVRGGDLNSRFVVCADGSLSSRRILPFLKRLLPAVFRPIEMFWVCTPEMSETETREAKAYLDKSCAWLEKRGQTSSLVQVTGEQPLDAILKKAGENSIIVLGASLRHDVYRRMLGSLPLQIMSETGSSVLLVKQLPEPDIDL